MFRVDAVHQEGTLPPEENLNPSGKGILFVSLTSSPYFMETSWDVMELHLVTVNGGFAFLPRGKKLSCFEPSRMWQPWKIYHPQQNKTVLY